nr:MAG TPA: hypothetical protein [Caudoviricetes sp.]
MPKLLNKIGIWAVCLLVRMQTATGDTKQEVRIQ